jgi:hypothetical protein
MSYGEKQNETAKANFAARLFEWLASDSLVSSSPVDVTHPVGGVLVAASVREDER